MASERKKSKFWSGVGKFVRGALPIIATVINPVAGGLVGGLLKRMPEGWLKKASAKVQETGAIDQAKIAETMQKQGIEPTNENLKIATEALKTASSDPLIGPPTEKDSKSFDWKKWLPAIIGGVVVVLGGLFWVFRPKTGKRRY